MRSKSYRSKLLYGGIIVAAAEPGTPVPGTEDPAYRTRPVQVDRRAAKRSNDIQRYTVDLDREQRRTLALLSAEWEVDKSKIIRTLLYLLEADESLRERVQTELFSTEEDS